VDHITAATEGAFRDAVSAMVRHVARDTPQRSGLSLCTIDTQSRRRRYLDFGFQECSQHPDHRVFLLKAAAAKSIGAPSGRPTSRNHALNLEQDSHNPQRIAK
jgi:hypothetical protein